MAKKAAVKKSGADLVGTFVKFKGYEGDDPGELKDGSIVKVLAFSAKQNLYNVQAKDGTKDALVIAEIESGDYTGYGEDKPAVAKAKTKPAKSAPPVEDDEEEEEEDEDTGDEEDEDLDEDEEEDEEEETPPAKSKAKAKSAKDKPAKPAPVAEKAAKTAPKAKTKEATAPAKKTGKASAKQAAAEEVPLPAFKKTVSVKAALEAAKGDAMKAAVTLANEKERNTFAFGGVLAYIKRNPEETYLMVLSDQEDAEGNALPYYSEGLKGFNEYVMETFGIKPRAAGYYVDLYEKFSQLTTEAAIAKIGWTKLRELLPLPLTKDTVDEWLEKAKELSSTELRDEVIKTLTKSGKKLHGNTNTDTTELTSFKFAVPEDQANTVDEALDKAKEVLGAGASPSACLVHILQEWLTFDTSDTDADEDEDSDEEDED